MNLIIGIQDMRKILLIPALMVFMMPGLVHADDSWTDIGVYGFISDIDGEIRTGNVTSDVDVPFKDILENLDMGFMAFAEHRREKWSFIGDVFYADISVDDTVAVSPTLSVGLDVGVKQTLAEGFVGYRVYEQKNGDAQLGVDLLAGVRYNKIEVDIGVEAAALGVSSASRNGDVDWADGAVGVRAQYGFGNGWGMSGWADAGEGSDSSSYQLMGLVNYQYDEDIRLFAGYRHYHFEYEGRVGALPYKLDLDFSGPMLGLSKRF